MFKWLREKAFNKFLEKNRSWWFGIQGQADLTNAQIAANIQIALLEFQEASEELSRSKGIRAFSDSIVAARTDPFEKKMLDLNIKDMLSDFEEAIVAGVYETRNDDKRRLRLIEEMDPRSGNSSSKYRYKDQSNQTVVLDKFELMGEAEFLWERARHPWCKLFEGRSDIKPYEVDNIYKEDVYVDKRPPRKPDIYEQDHRKKTDKQPKKKKRSI